MDIKAFKAAFTTGCGGIDSRELLHEVPGRQREAPAGGLAAGESDLVQLPGRFRGHGRLDLEDCLRHVS